MVGVPTAISESLFRTVFLSVFISNSIYNLRLLFSVIVFYTILSYSLPNGGSPQMCKVQIHNTSDRYTWQCSKECL